MSDILIKGMEMPKDGRLTLQIGCDGSVYTVNRFKITAEKYECDMKAISVPSHGKLIDADALAKYLGITDMDCHKCAWGNHGFCGRGGDFNDACEAIEEAPTVIEAEEET